MDESGIRKLKAVGLALVFLPIELFYLAASIYYFFPGVILLIVGGTIVFLVGYAMSPEKPGPIASYASPQPQARDEEPTG